MVVINTRVTKATANCTQVLIAWKRGQQISRIQVGPLLAFMMMSSKGRLFYFSEKKKVCSFYKVWMFFLCIIITIIIIICSYMLLIISYSLGRISRLFHICFLLETTHAKYKLSYINNFLKVMEIFLIKVWVVGEKCFRKNSDWNQAY